MSGEQIILFILIPAVLLVTLLFITSTILLMKRNLSIKEKGNREVTNICSASNLQHTKIIITSPSYRSGRNLQGDFDKISRLTDTEDAIAMF